MKYTIAKVTPAKRKLIKNFFQEHHSECNVDPFLQTFTHVVLCREKNLVIAVMPIIKAPFNKNSAFNLGKDFYTLYRTVVHTDHRRQGICNNMLSMATKLLIDKGAKTIQVTKSSLNHVKAKRFTDMGYKLTETHPKEKEFKHTYRWGKQDGQT